MAVFKSDFEIRIGERLFNDSVLFYQVFFCHKFALKFFGLQISNFLAKFPEFQDYFLLPPKYTDDQRVYQPLLF